jgi:hypothetical protein
MAGDRDVLVKGLRVQVQTIPDRFDDATVWALRSEFLALDAYLRVHPREASEKAQHALERALDLAGTAHAFTSELRGFLGQKDKSEKASWFDLSSIGILAVENLLTADRITLPRILMSSLSEALMFLASRQYVGGAEEVLRGLYRQHASSMYKELWTLATDYRKSLTAKDVKEMQAGIDGFFARLEAAPLQARISVLRQFYALLLMLRAAELLEALGG